MVVKKVLSEPGMHIKQNTLMNKYNVLLVRKRISAKIQHQKTKMPGFCTKMIQIHLQYHLFSTYLELSYMAVKWLVSRNPIYKASFR